VLVDQVSLLPVSCYDLDHDRDSVLEPSVAFTSDPVFSPTPSSVDPTSRYLYALDLHLQDTRSDRSAYYNQSVNFCRTFDGKRRWHKRSTKAGGWTPVATGDRVEAKTCLGAGKQ